jgi:hypothetical protein
MEIGTGYAGTAAAQTASMSAAFPPVVATPASRINPERSRVNGGIHE